MTFGNLVGSLFFAAIITKCELVTYLGPFIALTAVTDSGIISTAPYNAYAVTFAL